MKRYDRKTDFAVSVLAALAFAYIGLIALGGVGFLLVWMLAIGLLVWWPSAKKETETYPERTISPKLESRTQSGSIGTTPMEV